MNLFQAIKKGSLTDIEDCLARKEPVSMVDTSGFTPLHWAAITDNPNAIALLVKHGADINTSATRLKVTPLHLATARNASESVEMLIALGANINIEAANGTTALDFIFSLNEKADAIGALAEFLPAVKLAEKTNYAFDSLLSLLSHHAVIKDVKRFEQVVFNALVHDRADVVRAAQIHGYHYRDLQDGMAIPVLGFPLPFEVAIGYDYALIIAMSNGSLNCLKYIHSIDSSCFHSKADTISKVTGSNPLLWAAQQMPEAAVFNAVNDFIALQATEKLTLETTLSHLPAALSQYKDDINFNYDRKNQRYYISSLLVGLCALYFDEQGQPKHLDERRLKLTEMLHYLKDEHSISVTDTDKMDDYVAKYIVECPLAIMQVFIDFGVTFRGIDFQRALNKQTPDVIKAMIPISDMSWKNKEGKDALAVLMESENDALLNERPALMRMIEAKQAKELTDKLSALVVTEVSDLVVSTETLSFTPGFDAKRPRAANEPNQVDDLSSKRVNLKI